MYSNPAIDYLIRKRTIKKHKFVIKTKILLASYSTFAIYLFIKYFGDILMKIEPVVYGGIAVLIFSLYYMSTEKKQIITGEKK